MSSTATADRSAAPAPSVGSAAGAKRRWWQVAIAVVVIALVALVVRNVAFAGEPAKVNHTMPQNAAMEDRLGIRFSRVAVVADGGLVNLSYVVLDSEKAARFQADKAHPPVLRSEERPGKADRVSLMKQGHQLRAGQQYYFVYQDPSRLVRSGEKIKIVYGDLVLRHVPVW